MSMLRLAARRKCLQAFGYAAAIGFCFQSEARADITVNIAAASGADVGSGTGATIAFPNNSAGQGF
jgi:hypothetical protein